MKITDYRPYHNLGLGQIEEEKRQKLRQYFSLLAEVKDPMVSLVVPIYRAKETLMAHIISLSEMSTIIPYEVIFVDNNADQASLSILKGVGAKVVKEGRQGITYARQKGLEQAKGDIVCTMDPDSIYGEHYVDRMALPFFENKNLVLCHTISRNYAKDFQLPWSVKLRNFLKRWYFKAKMSAGFFNRITSVRAHGLSFRRDVLEGTGYPTDLRSVSGCDDGMLAVLLYAQGDFKYVSASVYTERPIGRAPGKPFPYCNERYFQMGGTAKQLSTLNIKKAI